MKAMSIITLVVSAITLLGAYNWNNVEEYEAAIGWAMILSLWSIAFGIVTLVKSKK